MLKETPRLAKLVVDRVEQSELYKQRWYLRAF